MAKSIWTVLSPLLIINYVSGLRIVEFPTGHARPWLSFLYILLLWSTYYYVMYSTTMSYINLYPVLNNICYWLNNITTLLSIIFGMYHDKKFRHCMKKLAIVDVTLERLGTKINYQQLYMKIVWLALGWFVTSILIDYIHILYIQYQYNYDIAKSICISIIQNYCAHINLIDDLTVASILGYIGLKFDEINKHLQNLVYNNKQAIKRAWENPSLDSQYTLPKISNSKWKIWIIMHLHLELCKISRKIDLIFGIQMTFKMGCYFGYMAMNLYELFQVIFVNNYIKNHSSMFVCIQLTWFFHNILKLFLVNYICEKVSTKANATKTFANRVLHSTCNVENENVSVNINLINVIKINIDLSGKIKNYDYLNCLWCTLTHNRYQLLLQMTRSPLRFYGLGLFQFGFKFLQGFITSVTTVLVILIQAHTNK